jgi:hypothetical protein
MELVVPNLGRQMHVEPPEHLVRWCQYLYSCTKASTFVLVKQARCSRTSFGCSYPEIVAIYVPIVQ